MHNNNSLISLNQKKTGQPLFLVHPIGGQIYWYQTLGRYFDSPLYGIEAEGLHKDIALPKTMEEMADIYVNNLIESYPSTSYVIGGWSFGCEVAFEMVKSMTKKGYHIPLLIVIDPQIMIANLKNYLCTIFNYLTQEQQSSIECTSLIEDSKNLAFTEGINLAIEKIKLLKSKNLSEVSIVKKLLFVYCNNIKIMQTYKRQGKVENLLFITATKKNSVDVCHLSNSAQRTDWEFNCDSILNTINFEANHYSILQKENAKKLTNIIADYL